MTDNNIDVAHFTGVYHPSINGVVYTIDGWRSYWRRNNGRFAVAYPDAPDYIPRDDEYAAPTLPWSFPFTQEYPNGWIAWPNTPAKLNGNFDIVHTHSPYFMGRAAAKYAEKQDAPLFATYHTPAGEYIEHYLTDQPFIQETLKKTAEVYEGSYYNTYVDHLFVPSAPIKQYVQSTLNVEIPVSVVSNGVNTEHFRPSCPKKLLKEHDLWNVDKSLIGYAGRLGHEKRVQDFLYAAKDIDAKVLVAGDGPARPKLEKIAKENNIDAYFFGMVDRERLPAFYTAIDVFGFSSPIETEGVVALEAYACGTPVVGRKERALKKTIDHGVTGYHFEPGNIAQFTNMLKKALANNQELADNCLEKRQAIGTPGTIRKIVQKYREYIKFR